MCIKIAFWPHFYAPLHSSFVIILVIQPKSCLNQYLEKSRDFFASSLLLPLLLYCLPTGGKLTLFTVDVLSSHVVPLTIETIIAWSAESRLLLRKMKHVQVIDVLSTFINAKRNFSGLFGDNIKRSKAFNLCARTMQNAFRGSLYCF